MKLRQIEWPIVAKAVAKEYKKDDIPGLSAEMAYHFIFALFPFVIFLATVAGMIGRLVRQDRLLEDILDALYQQLPPETVEALRGPLEQVLGQRGNEALSIGAAVGLVLALWSASSGVATVMKAFNRAYGVEETRGFIKQKLIAVGMTVVLSLFLIVGVVGLTAGNDLIELAAGALGLGGVTEFLLQGLRILLSLVGIVLAFSLLYWQGPNVDQQFRWVTAGSLISTIALALLSFGFGIYVNLVGAASYAKTYGAAFGLILFLYFLYLASQVILLGAEFNAEVTKRYDPDTIRDKITDPRKQLPGEQPAPHPQAAREAGVTQEQVRASNRTSAEKVAAGGGGPETATKGGAGASGNASAESGATNGTTSVAAGSSGANGAPHSANGATQRPKDGSRSGGSIQLNGAPGVGGAVAGSGVAAGRDRSSVATGNGSDGGDGSAVSRTITPSESPVTRPSAEEAPRRGIDRTRLVTFAVSGAAVAGAFAMGLLRRDRER